MKQVLQRLAPQPCPAAYWVCFVPLPPAGWGNYFFVCAPCCRALSILLAMFFAMWQHSIEGGQCKSREYVMHNHSLQVVNYWAPEHAA